MAPMRGGKHCPHIPHQSRLSIIGQRSPWPPCKFLFLHKSRLFSPTFSLDLKHPQGNWLCSHGERLISGAPAQCNDRACFGMFLKIEVTMPTHNQYSIRGLFQEIFPILLYIPREVYRFYQSGCSGRMLRLC